MKLVVIGNDKPIIQSVLDFDYVSGNKPSIIAIIATGGKNKFFWNNKEIYIPTYASFDELPSNTVCNSFLNLSSGRRVYSSTVDIIARFPSMKIGVIFGENVPEIHAINLFELMKEKNISLIGPSSVGILIPGICKIGPICGTEPKQFIENHLMIPGKVAVFSSSGGMTNELVSIVSKKSAISFALSFGGDRFPLLTPLDAMITAEKDKETELIVYFGELGGYDEYLFAEAIQQKKITKPIIAYIAGSVAEIFKTPPQFGHAKAIAKQVDESAQAKKKMLKQVGVMVADSFSQFVSLINEKAPQQLYNDDYTQILTSMQNRKSTLFTSSISGEKNGEVFLLGESLIDFTQKNSLAFIIGSMFLGKKMRSKEFESLLDVIIKMLVDHGPYVSGAVNTMVTARAGRDLVSSLSAGLLTIGPRFGGAVNEAAHNWIEIYKNNEPIDAFVERFAKIRTPISGIGHKKYSKEIQDPRIKELLSHTKTLKKSVFLHIAQQVELITLQKKSNLILNVDGMIAAVLLDVLMEKEEYTVEELDQLVHQEFFNAIFVISRSIGFTAHFLDQKRLGEGLFRLSNDDVNSIGIE